MIKEVLYCDNCGQQIKEMSSKEEEYVTIISYGHHKTMDLCKDCAHSMYFKYLDPCGNGEGYIYKKVL